MTTINSRKTSLTPSLDAQEVARVLTEVGVHYIGTTHALAAINGAMHTLQELDMVEKFACSQTISGDVDIVFVVPSDLTIVHSMLLTLVPQSQLAAFTQAVQNAGGTVGQPASGP